MKTRLSLIVILFIGLSAMSQTILRNYDTTNLTPFATSTQAGDVIPDNVTITIGANGVISASGGGTTTAGVTNIVQALKTNLPNVTVTNLASFQSAVGVSSLVVTNGQTNLNLTASTDLEADANKQVVSLANGLGVKTNNNAGGVGWSTGIPASWIVGATSGGSLFPPNALGVLTNNGSGFTNWSTSISGTWIGTGTLPVTAADSSWAPVTNYISLTNIPFGLVNQAPFFTDGTNQYGSPTVIPAYLVTPPSSGSTNVVMEKSDGSRIPYDLATLLGLVSTGQTPWNSDINGAGRSLYQVADIMMTNSGAFVGMLFHLTNNATYGEVLTLSGTTNNVPGPSTLSVSNIISGSVMATVGSISVIPTNAAPTTLVLSASGISLPIGITNTFAGRAEPIIRYYMVDAVAGTPCMTLSNETTRVKLVIGAGALTGLTTTNFAMLPITTTNQIWRIRDESGGTGASVGILTNWLNGL